MRRYFSSVALMCSLTIASSAASAKIMPVREEIPAALRDMPAEMSLEPDPSQMPAMPIAPAVPDRDTLRTILADRRATNLAIFHAYVVAQQYPSNTFRNRLANVWKDAEGHPCAVANMVIGSGNVALFDQVAETDNFIKVANVKDGEFADWILTSGLTQQELALIQRPFQPVAAKPVGPAATPQFAKPPQAMPAQPAAVTIDARKKAQDVARLAKLYASIEAKLAANSKRSVEIAVTRLMKDRDLALSTMMYARRAPAGRS
ncbi:MAG TPA: hypothetical protein PLF40_15980 [Kofleriaceae bacterium]|nr:hypothetical protein [Kofleriaceae bacterium]